MTTHLEIMLFIVYGPPSVHEYDLHETNFPCTTVTLWYHGNCCYGNIKWFLDLFMCEQPFILYYLYYLGLVCLEEHLQGN